VTIEILFEYYEFGGGKNTLVVEKITAHVPRYAKFEVPTRKTDGFCG
jgi:hypothetical protein